MATKNNLNPIQILSLKQNLKISITKGLDEAFQTLPSEKSSKIFKSFLVIEREIFNSVDKCVDEFLLK